MICPDCQAGTRVHKVEGKLRLRECLSCKKRFRTEEVLLHEVGAMTKERLIKFLMERKNWQSYTGLAHHFAVSKTAVQSHMKQLEGEGLVISKIEGGQKLWQLANKPVPESPLANLVTPKPEAASMAVSDSGRVIKHRIARPEEEASSPKSRTKTKPVQQQSWFSIIEK
jgi:biotin operon repressor